MMKMPERNVPTAIIDRLRQQRTDLEARLATLNEAIGALEKHPDVAEAINAISKIGDGRW
jgi:hypothetical protein